MASITVWQVIRPMHIVITAAKPTFRDDMGENLWAWQCTRGSLSKTDDQMAKEAVDAWYR